METQYEEQPRPLGSNQCLRPDRAILSPHCLPGCAPVKSWSQEPEVGTEPRLFDADSSVSTAAQPQGQTPAPGSRILECKPAGQKSKKSCSDHS